MEAAKQVKLEGLKNDLLDRIAGDPQIGMTRASIDKLLSLDAFVGRAPQQTREFIAGTVDPLLARAKRYGAINKMELTV